MLEPKIDLINPGKIHCTEWVDLKINKELQDTELIIISNFSKKSPDQHIISYL